MRLGDILVRVHIRRGDIGIAKQCDFGSESLTSGGVALPDLTPQSGAVYQRFASRSVRHKASFTVFREFAV